MGHLVHNDVETESVKNTSILYYIYILSSSHWVLWTGGIYCHFVFPYLNGKVSSPVYALLYRLLLLLIILYNMFSQ